MDRCRMGFASRALAADLDGDGFVLNVHRLLDRVRVELNAPPLGPHPWHLDVELLPVLAAWADEDIDLHLLGHARNKNLPPPLQELRLFDHNVPEPADSLCDFP